MQSLRILRDTNFSAKYRMDKFNRDAQLAYMEKSNPNTTAFKRKPYYITYKESLLK